MFYEGLKLMVAGMGTVFVFLVLMIFIVGQLAKVLAPFAGILEEKKDPVKRLTKKKPAKKSDDKAVYTAISAAVHQYRKDNQK